MTDFRAVLERLVELDKRIEDVIPGIEIDNWIDAMDAARAALDEPEGEGPSDQELERFLAERHRARMESESAFGCPDFDGAKAKAARTADTRAAIARWGRPAAPAVEPIPVSERLPNDGDCLVTSLGLRYCWWASEVYHSGQVRLIWQWKSTIEQHDLDWCFVYWLPSSTQFLPTTLDSDQPT